MIDKTNLKTKSTQLASMHKYNLSEKGKLAKKKYFESHKEELRKYNSNYLKNRRIQAKEKHLCHHCFKLPAQTGTLCAECREKNKIYQINYRAKKKEVEST